MHSSIEPGWRTPPRCFEALDREFNFSMDAAACKDDTFCPIYCGPDRVGFEDGLGVDWLGLSAGDTIFLNPPYSKTLSAAYRCGKIKIDGAWHEHPVDLQKARGYQIESWAAKCWQESQRGCTIVGLFPFSPQTDWYREYVMGHGKGADPGSARVECWNGFAATEERRLSHRVSFLRPDGSPADNAGVNSVVIVWRPAPGIVGPWTPLNRYWSYR